MSASRVQPKRDALQERQTDACGFLSRPWRMPHYGPRGHKSCETSWMCVHELRSGKATHSCSSSKAGRSGKMGPGEESGDGKPADGIGRMRSTGSSGVRDVGVESSQQGQGRADDCRADQVDAGGDARPVRRPFHPPSCSTRTGSCVSSSTGSPGTAADRYPLSPMAGARWFSQAWLPSAFMSRYRGDRLAEARTHADGVLGHFIIGDPGTAALTLMPDARQLVVLEAKLFARLSAGRAQRARITTRRRGASPASPRRCGASIGIPTRWMTWRSSCWRPRPGSMTGSSSGTWRLDAIRRKVRRRVEDYAGERDHWFRDWFEPTWRRLEVRVAELGGRRSTRSPSTAWRTATSSTASMASACGSTGRSRAAACRGRRCPSGPGPRSPGPRPFPSGRASPDDSIRAGSRHGASRSMSHPPSSRRV